ncbi:MAG TPA: transcriptional regulator [Candidatus Acidoferrum sp.]|nr:transcriptional regulator [Candidatus Acidoferrum sp.]
MKLDKLVHEPARLVILTVLAEADEMEFRFLKEISGLNKGNLSGHLSKLEEAGYVAVEKFFRGKVPVTSLKITRAGRTALQQYRAQLKEVLHPKQGVLTAIKKRLQSASS